MGDKNQQESTKTIAFAQNSTWSGAAENDVTDREQRLYAMFWMCDAKGIRQHVQPRRKS